MESSLDDQVLAEYKAIFALPPDQITKALIAYNENLRKSCTKENPCPECLREYKNQLEELAEQ